ncbi:hypothetical protein [Corynebacterium ulcerans]|uniref:hypothetical protein n=1 Tax=Corynebacterium ulcerans TaxID=65058 RepID=UPI00051F65B2|nr:hypothetical protein [Corynebacterium ulcerans]AIT89302.1 Hypothetical protein Cul210932_1356 [Corynebacterium ulcerans]ALD95077.1 Hypothetical protein Cul131001_1373 [Corynebacterium ulcerans]
MEDDSSGVADGFSDVLLIVLGCLLVDVGEDFDAVLDVRTEVGDTLEDVETVLVVGAVFLEEASVVGISADPSIKAAREASVTFPQWRLSGSAPCLFSPLVKQRPCARYERH